MLVPVCKTSAGLKMVLLSQEGVSFCNLSFQASERIADRISGNLLLLPEAVNDSVSFLTYPLPEPSKHCGYGEAAGSAILVLFPAGGLVQRRPALLRPLS